MSELKFGIGIVILMICGVLTGTAVQREHMEKFIGRSYDNVIQYEKDLCNRSEPIDVPCAAVFVKYHKSN